jgi:hypothetical protein
VAINLFREVKINYKAKFSRREAEECSIIDVIVKQHTANSQGLKLISLSFWPTLQKLKIKRVMS